MLLGLTTIKYSSASKEVDGLLYLHTQNHSYVLFCCIFFCHVRHFLASAFNSVWLQQCSNTGLIFQWEIRCPYLPDHVGLSFVYRIDITIYPQYIRLSDIGKGRKWLYFIFRIIILMRTALFSPQPILIQLVTLAFYLVASPRHSKQYKFLLQLVSSLHLPFLCLYKHM